MIGQQFMLIGILEECVTLNGIAAGAENVIKMTRSGNGGQRCAVGLGLFADDIKGCGCPAVLSKEGQRGIEIAGQEYRNSRIGLLQRCEECVCFVLALCSQFVCGDGFAGAGQISLTVIMLCSVGPMGIGNDKLLAGV